LIVPPFRFRGVGRELGDHKLFHNEPRTLSCADLRASKTYYALRILDTLLPMPLLNQIQKDMTAAIKAGEQARLDALRMIKTALKKHEIDSMKPLDEQTELQILNTLIKQRRESAEMFRKGNRPELADREEAELKLIESYMPSAPTDAEIDAAIAAAMSETGATALKQMGAVMKAAQAKLAGKRVDGKALSERVRARLT
jgi:uncharacterized protein YqeY